MWSTLLNVKIFSFFFFPFFLFNHLGCGFKEEFHTTGADCSVRGSSLASSLKAKGQGAAALRRRRLRADSPDPPETSSAAAAAVVGRPARRRNGCFSCPGRSTPEDRADFPSLCQTFGPRGAAPRRAEASLEPARVLRSARFSSWLHFPARAVVGGETQIQRAERALERPNQP